MYAYNYMILKREKLKVIYLDNSATTKPSKAAVDAAVKAMSEVFGNPSSLHSLGFEAQNILTLARKNIAKVLSAREDEIYFTSGGTESNNIAVFGSAYARKKRGNRIVSTAVEHSSVKAALDELEKEGFEVIRLMPDEEGNISLSAFNEAIDEKTVLVTCMAVNNETGAVFPVEKIRRIITARSAPALFHIDAVQAFGKMPLSVRSSDADLITASAHKIHGIKGCGVLWIKKGTTLRKRTFGGLQENSLRPGTEAVPAIAAMGAAAAEINAAETAEKCKNTKEAFVEELSRIDGVVINSPRNGASHILNISVPGYKSETLLHALEKREIYVSSGSACKKGEKSYVLAAQRLSDKRIDSALRISFCRDNSPDEAEIFAQSLKEIMGTIANTLHKN